MFQFQTVVSPEIALLVQTKTLNELELLSERPCQAATHFSVDHFFFLTNQWTILALLERLERMNDRSANERLGTALSESESEQVSIRNASRVR